MSKLRGILFFGLVFTLGLSLSAMAGGPSRDVTFLQGASTTSQSAVFATFMSALEGGFSGPNGVDGQDTAISVSNILATPNGLSGAVTNAQTGPGGDSVGGLTFFLWDRDGTSYRFSTVEHPDVGAGQDANGMLSPGQTYTVLLNEVLANVTGGPVTDFVGYAWIVADFDAVAGGYVNFFPGLQASENFEMVPQLGGIPTTVTVGGVGGGR